MASPLSHLRTACVVTGLPHVVPVEFARHMGGAGNADPRIVEQARQPDYFGETNKRHGSTFILIILRLLPDAFPFGSFPLGEVR